MMVSPFDYEIHSEHLRRERLGQAQMEALARQAAPRTPRLRSHLALALHALADRLDTPRVAPSVAPARSAVR